MELDLPIKLFGRDKSSASGSVKVEHYSSAKIGMRAGITLVIGLIVTALMALVPVLHFILVPVGLLLTLVGTLLMARSSTVILEGHGLCPNCQKPFRISRQPLRSKFEDRCSFCSQSVQIVCENLGKQLKN